VAVSLERSRRLFVAVAPPREVVDFLLATQDAIRRTPDVRFLRREQLHLTLAFLGEVGEPMVDAVRRLVRSVPREWGGHAVIGGFLFLPDQRRTRVIAVDVKDAAGVLRRLHDRLAGSLVEAGLMKPEKRPFRPHITIGRLRTPGLVRLTHDCGKVRFGVESVRLYESKLSREGATYQVLEEVVLRGSE